MTSETGGIPGAAAETERDNLDDVNNRNDGHDDDDSGEVRSFHSHYRYLHGEILFAWRLLQQRHQWFSQDLDVGHWRAGCREGCPSSLG